MKGEKALRLQDLFPGTHIKTIQLWCRTGKVPGAFRLSRTWLIRAADWQDLVKAKKAEALVTRGGDPADCQGRGESIKN